MQNGKLIHYSTLAAVIMLSLHTARVLTDSQAMQPVTDMTMTPEKPSYFSGPPPKSASTDRDTQIKLYYLGHISEFQPLPHSPHERAKVWNQIKSVIEKKI